MKKNLKPQKAAQIRPKLTDKIDVRRNLFTLIGTLLFVSSSAQAKLPNGFCDSIANSFTENFLPHPHKIHSLLSPIPDAPDPAPKDLMEALNSAMKSKCDEQVRNEGDAILKNPGLDIMTIRAACVNSCKASFSSPVYADASLSCESACSNYKTQTLDVKLKAMSIGPLGSAQPPVKVEVVAATNVTPVQLGVADASCDKPEPLKAVAAMMPASTALAQNPSEWKLKDEFKDIKIYAMADFNSPRTKGQTETPFPNNPNCGFSYPPATGEQAIDIHAEENTFNSLYRIESHGHNYHKESTTYEITRVDDSKSDRITLRLRFFRAAHYPGEDLPDFSIYCKKKNGEDPTVADFDQSNGPPLFKMNSHEGKLRLMPANATEPDYQPKR